MSKRSNKTKSGQTSDQGPNSKTSGKPQKQLKRTYKGHELVVEVLDDCYKFEGETYR